jgi:aryl-alcohol dehydrogenase-like predicted oxidoreductase
MKQRPLGHTGINVSEIAFGGVEIGMPYGIGMKTRSDMIPEPEAIHLLHEAIDRGINFFDTARLYGESESIMGRAFRDRRDRVVICSKCPPLYDQDGHLPPADKWIRIIKDALQFSLRELKTDYIDVYMLHQSDVEILDNEMIADFFVHLKKEGVIRATGASTYTLDETGKAIDGGTWDVIQVPFNLMDQTQGTMFSKAADNGIGIMVRSVLLRGILGKKGQDLHPALKDVARNRRRFEALLPDSIPDLATLAIKFVLSFDQISSVLIGIDCLDYLHDALAAADGKYLNEKTLSEIRQLGYPDPELINLREWDSRGWLT